MPAPIGRMGQAELRRCAFMTYRLLESASSLSRRLDAHHRSITSVLAWARPFLTRDSAPEAFVSNLASKRMELSRLLMEYALFKHRDIFAVAIGAGGDMARIGLKLKAACIAAGEEYRDYVKSDDRVEPSVSWEVYRLRALAMLETMQDHFAEERAAIRELLGLKTRPVRLATASPGDQGQAAAGCREGSAA